MVIQTLNVEGPGVPVRIWTDTLAGAESQALDQALNTARLPWVFDHVALMPDFHFGKGATVGSVVAMRGAVAPSAVGVDIGCGMAAVRTNLRGVDLPDDLGPLRRAVETAIPLGQGRQAHRDGPADGVTDLPLWDSFDRLHPKVQARRERAVIQMGSLGGGNHFIELCLDADGAVWLMLHSGSRNIGKELADAHIGIAKTLEHNAGLPDPDLAVFLSGTAEMAAYRHDLDWAQRYAATNRRTMLRLYSGVLTGHFPQIAFDPAVNCHHNYVNEEVHQGATVLVTRKGAISARAGELGIIPGSMGTRSFIVRGLGNPESFTSASHGAGRRMSRGAAKRTFTVEDLAEQTRGVECRKDAGVLDEIPGSYKDIDQVMDNQRDLVEVVATLRAVMCVKG